MCIFLKYYFLCTFFEKTIKKKKRKQIQFSFKWMEIKYTNINVIPKFSHIIKLILLL